MNRYKEKYDERKAGVLRFLDQLIGYLDENEDEAAAPIKKLRENVAGDLFGIVLVGEFSAGKSSFLNALMGKRILPSFSEETTATINFLRHSSCAPNGEPGIVYYQDGREPTVLPAVTLEEIEKVVSTRGNTNDEKIAATVDHVDLFLDSELLRNGVMLVDSPGLNGMAANHKEMTERQIKASHACIFMFNAQRPGSKTDFEALRELKEGNKNIFFVLNKIDAIRPEEHETVESVIASLKKNYHEQFPEETEIPQIWPVSAWEALAARDPLEDGETRPEARSRHEDLSRIRAFEDRLWQYLTEGEKARAQLSGPVEQGLITLKKQLEYQQARASSLSSEQTNEDIQKRAEYLEEQKKKLQQERKKIAPALQKEVKDVLDRLRESAAAKGRQLTQQVESRTGQMETEEELREYAGNLERELPQSYLHAARKLTEELREEFLYLVQTEYEDYFNDLENRFEEISGNAVLAFQGEKLELSAHAINANLEQFETWCSEMQSKIEQKEQQMADLETRSIQARQLQRRIDAQKAELTELKERERYVRDNFIIPEVTYRSEQRTESHWRGGLLGFLGTLLIGKKESVRNVTIEDDSAQKRAEKEREDELRRIEQERQELLQRLPADSAPDASPELVEAQRRKAQDELDKLENELIARQEQYREDLKEKAEKNCKIIRRDLRRYAENTEDEVVREIGRYLNQQNRNYIQAVQDMVNLSLEQELQATAQKLEELARLAASEGEERTKALEKAGQLQQALRQLIDQGTELQVMLEEEMNDHVEQEAL